ncbi:hypothetical protein NGR_b03340 (plasmid) [Sinorhizobium fredii NGR234]|uniref:Uncharacterized protein n=1 Tax=Sinorhizobium fredii (strain NBRC 101917 / NGR234) TaxID=394 RepID=Q6W1V8_SINFN|nr:hypothetical protein [Sinorhizobium fredii]AAQ87260.1 Hypothetical protein RNGR00487 [Sinorhizobium fredii NGR234]ACP21798.1 hypothetical protein NGR_b03340 [Sinorhizobium fredii NGR234]
MTVTLDQAIAKMEATGDWEFDEDTLWSDKDIADYEAETGLLKGADLPGRTTRASPAA